MSYPPVQVRAYPGRTQRDASARLAQDAATMAAAGYQPSSQLWAETGGLSLAGKAWLAIAVVATVGGALFWPLWIGAIVCLLIGLTGRKRGGDLTVTWTMAGSGQTHSMPDRPIDAPQPAPDLGDQLRALRQLLDEGLISQSEFDALKGDVLARM